MIINRSKVNAPRTNPADAIYRSYRDLYGFFRKNTRNIG
ncbi:hypothetical protein PITCH_A1690007 [uncultured Desulfobacterium sp.]|uniref:Uncharacterized protein n=1 Tax=uncultured Desulfobacterium sp. TaxID=201089 RepID=A0A445MUF6_9BACT|nr:hypothetical protein PITCH_A1690007 [uncultured Desulfobacterium sp.]